MPKIEVFTVAGTSVTKGKARFHVTNVRLSFYKKLLEQRGRSRIRLIKLPMPMSRKMAAQYLLENLTALTNTENDVLTFITSTGKITRLHQFSKLPGNKSFIKDYEY